MTVQITRRGGGIQVTPAADHHGVTPRRLHGVEIDPSQALAVTMSTFQPGASVDSGPVPRATVYLVVAGEVDLTTEDGADILHAGDSVHVPAGTVRRLAVGDASATVLVVRGS